MRNATLDEFVTSSRNFESPNVELDESQYGDVSSKLFKFVVDYYEFGNDTEISNFDIEEVLVYLKASHKFYLRKKLPEIEQSMANYFIHQDESNTLLSSLALFFGQYIQSFIRHIQAEEKEFFPYIQTLIDFEEDPSKESYKTHYLQENSIEKFNDKHDSIEDDLQKVSEIVFASLGEKELPLPFRVFLNQIELFELDLRKHAVIEDFLLVPLALKLEERVKSNF